MTSPTPPDEPGPEPGPASEPGQYPRQPLTEQRVKAARSLRPLVVAALVVVLVVVAVVVTLRVLHDRGERTRAAYCAALRSATSGGDLSQALGGADQAHLAGVVHRLQTLAPDAVRGQWDDLAAILTTARTATPDMAEAARLVTDLQTIGDDARSNCGITMRF